MRAATAGPASRLIAALIVCLATRGTDAGVIPMAQSRSRGRGLDPGRREHQLPVAVLECRRNVQRHANQSNHHINHMSERGTLTGAVAILISIVHSRHIARLLPGHLRVQSKRYSNMHGNNNKRRTALLLLLGRRRGLSDNRNNVNFNLNKYFNDNDNNNM